MRAKYYVVLMYYVVLAMAQLGCGAGGISPQAISLFPSSVIAGQSGFVLDVDGANFSPRSVISWNGTAQTTFFVSAQRLTAQIPSQDIAQASTVSVAVEDGQSGRTSNVLKLIVTGKNILQVTTKQLPAGQAGAAYSAPLSVSGGVSPYRWSVTSGVLPGGLAMDSQTGVISGMTENAGQFAFTTVVTDSENASASTSLAIDITAATPGTAPTGLQFYGPGIGSDGLANTTLGPSGNTVSYRFRTKRSGVLQQARVYLIPDHAGYAAGNGGTIQVTLNTDDGTSAHNPSSKVLATYMMTNVLSLASPARYFYVMKFSSPPTLTAGQLYHMVFKNVDANPDVNYLSVDALYEIVPTTPVQPTVSDTDAAELLSEDGSSWQPRAGYTPIYELDFQNGTSEGIGYMEGWVGAPQNISGTNAIRETFTVSGAQVKVTSASIRLTRLNGNDPLVVRLENADGSLIEQGNIPASAIALSTSSSSPLDVWATYTFSTTYSLLPGHTYHLDFEATFTSTYQAFPIRKGVAYGFQNTTYFPDGNAEFEQNGSWTGWTQWGVANRTDGDLQFYFTIVP